MPCAPEKKSYRDSYEVTLDTVKRENPSLSEHESKVQAAFRFRPYYRRISETARIEAIGGEQYENGEFTLTADGKMYFLKEHQTAEQLNINQLRLSQLPGHTASEYSLSDHQTTLLIQEAFQKGSQRVVTSFGNRDVLEYFYNPATKRGTIRVHNTAMDKNYHPAHEIQKIAKNKFAELHETKISKSIFVLSDKPLEESKVRQTIANVEQRVGNVIKESVVTAGKNTLREAKRTAASVRGYIRHTQDIRLKEIPIMAGDTLTYRVRRMFEQKEHKKGEAAVIKEINRIGRSLEKAKNARVKLREKIITSGAALFFVRATGVGTGGAFDHLRTIAQFRKPDFYSRSLERVKHVRRQKRSSFESRNTIIRPPVISSEALKRIKSEKEGRKRTLENMRALRKREAFKKLAKKERRAFRRKEKKPLKCKEGRKMRTKEILHSRKEIKVLHRKELKRLRRKELRLLKILKNLVETLERCVVSNEIKSKERSKKITVAQKETHQIKKREKQHVIIFSIAFVLWLLVGERYNVSLPVSPAGRYDNKKDKRIFQSKELKRIKKNTSAQWLLFAIIWHLAMIREAGVKNGKKLKKTKKQKTQYVQAPFLQQGVIFSYAS